MSSAVDVGLRGEARLVVGDEDTAMAMGTGDVPVIATPRVVALCEQAAIAAVAERLPAGTTTVGMRVQIDHLRPTGIGHEIIAEATLKHVEGRRLTFAVSVDDERGLVAAGKVTRVIVEIELFMEKAV